MAGRAVLYIKRMKWSVYSRASRQTRYPECFIYLGKCWRCANFHSNVKWDSGEPHISSKQGDWNKERRNSAFEQD